MMAKNQLILLIGLLSSVGAFLQQWQNLHSMRKRSDDEYSENELDISQIDLIKVPTKTLQQHSTVTSVSLSYNKIKSIQREDFPWMNYTLIIKLDGNYIDYIAPDAFANIPNLIEIDLSNNLLQTIPSFTQHTQVTTLNLQHNNIREISPTVMQNYPYLEHLDVMDNKIEVLLDNTFKENLYLEKLVLSINPLEEVQRRSLLGPYDLKTLYLRKTLISSLPHHGIQKLKKLDIRETERMFTIPDPELFKNLKEVMVTYSMHCCAFTEERERRKLNNSRRCDPNELKKNKASSIIDKRIEQSKNQTNNPDPFAMINNNFGTGNETEEITDEACSGRKVLEAMKLLQADLSITCTPKPDAFNPCQDVMGTYVLRVFSWIISIFAIFGNMFQLIILFHNRQELTVYKLLMYNLGFSNLMMGIYLLVLCCVDAYTYGKYYNYVRSWQYNGGCQVFGFIAVFATQLSLCTLVLITVERFLLIIFALQVNLQMKLRHAKVAVALSWIYALVVAMLPATNLVSNYTRVAICVPFKVATTVDAGYVFWLLLAYIIAFLQIVYCYVSMYNSISDTRNVSSTPNIDFQVAKRMSLIIFSNFLCWLPISITGLMAMYSNISFNVKVSKFLLVFVFPLNACTNPFLYAIFTKVFRGDILRLMSSCGLCVEAEQEHARRRAPPSSGFGRTKKPRSEASVSFRSHFEYTDTYRQRSDLESNHAQKEKQPAADDLHPTVAFACVNLNPSELSPMPNSTGQKKKVMRLVVDESNERNRTESNATCSTDRSLLSAVELEDDLSRISGSVSGSASRSEEEEESVLLR